MRFKNILLISILILLAADFSLANSSKTISIALIADKSSGLDKSPLIPFLEVELSQKEDIQLLERAKIDKILEEQQLSAAGLLDRNTTIKIGKLLRADAFIIFSLESRIEDANDLIRVRFAETAHGLRLTDFFEQPENTNLQKSVESIVQELESVLSKITQPDEKLIPVGIVDIHRVQLGEKYKMLERTLPTMLSVRLSLEPQIIMLEREDLKLLLDEKLLTEGDDSEFWNSAVLIDGYIQPNNGQLEMKLQLKQSGGDKIMSCAVPVEPNEVVVAIEKAATEIIQNLHDTPPVEKWNPEQEAEQFYKQGQMLSNHQRYEDAITLFETAHALQPNNVYYTGALFTRIWYFRRKIERAIIGNEIGISKYEMPEPCPYSDLEIAGLASMLVRQIRDGYKKGMLSANDIRFNWTDPYGPLDSTLSSSTYFSSYASVSNEKIKMINRENRRIWIEIASKISEPKYINREITQHAFAIAKARLAWFSSDDPNEWIVNLKKAFTDYIMPPERGGKIKQTLQRREDIFYHAFPAVFDNHSPSPLVYSFMRGSSEQFIKLWRDYLKEMTKIDEPIVKINCYVALALGGLHSDIEEYKIKSHDYGYKAFELIRDTFTNPDIYNNINIKEQLVTRFKKLTYMGVFDINESVQLWEDICERLIEQREIDKLVLLEPGFRPFTFGVPPSLFRYKEFYQRYYLLLDRIAEVLQIRKNDKKVNATIANIRDFQSDIRNKIPQLDVPYKTSRMSVTMLLTQEEWPQLQRRKFNVHVEIPIISQDEMLWIGFSSGATTGYPNSEGGTDWPIDIGLAGINIAHKEITAIWQSQIITSEPVHHITGLSITPEAIYLSLTNAGIIEFPGSLKKGRGYLEKPKVITEESSLPSNLVTSIFYTDSNLWVAYGNIEKESGLGLYNPQEDTWKTVFSSTLKSNTLFGAGKPYVIHAMQIVPPDKMFFLVYEPGIPRMVSSGNPEGLWMMNTETYEMKYLGPVWLEWPQRINVEYLNGQLLFKSWYFIIEIDPDSQRITKIMGDTTHLERWYSIKDIPLKLELELFVSESFSTSIKYGLYFTKGNLDLLTSTIHKDKLWARLGESQILIIEKGGDFEDAQIIDNNILGGEPVCRFVSTPYGLVAIGEGTVGLIETEE